MYNDKSTDLFSRISSIKPKSTRIIPITIGASAILFLIIVILAIKFTIEAHLSTVDLLYTPSSAVATIDGKEYPSGEIQLPPGRHEVIVEKYGFETESTTIETYPGQTTPAYFVLDSNQPFTADWYSNNYDDALTAQGISSREYDDQRVDILDEYPAFKKLPVKQNGFSIYQATCNGTQICVTIDASNAFRNEAIEYFRKNIDSDLGRYYFTFKNYTNPFMGEG